jgi:OOP family OmpA-OmpF porin
MRPFVASALGIGAALAAGCAADPPPDPLPPPPPAPVIATAEPAPPPPPVVVPPKKTRVRVTEFKVESTGLVLPGPIAFEPNSDKLSPQSDEMLEIVHDFLDAKPEITLLRIEGHTDSDGNAAMLHTLSEKRALAVARWLVGAGVKCERLIPVGFGVTKPAVPNDTVENKAQNRRIAFVPATRGGRPIGGMAVDGAGKVAGDPCR